MDTGQVRSMLFQNLKCSLDLACDAFDWSSFEIERALICVSMNWIWDPNDVQSCIIDILNHWRQKFFDLISHSNNENNLSHFVVRIQNFNSSHNILRIFTRSNFISYRIADPSEKFYMRLIKVSCSFAYPEELSRKTIESFVRFCSREFFLNLVFWSTCDFSTTNRNMSC